MGEMGTRQIRTGVGSLDTTLPHRCGAPGEDRQRQHLRWASADIRTLRTQEVGIDVDIWDVSGEMRGVGGAWDRSHMGQEGKNQGAQDERDVGLPKVGLAETDMGCLD